MKMKKVLSLTMLAGVAVIMPMAARAQVGGADTAAIAAQRAAMARLAPMRGLWRGPAVSRTPQGEMRLMQTERVGTFLDGTLTLVEGKGYRADGSVGFHAFGTIAFDPETKTYWMTSHAQGHSGRFEVKLRDDGWSWDMPAGPATIHYEAHFGDGTWSETGDYVAPGQPPRRFFEMTLTRIGDTDWPEAGGVAKE